MSYRVLSRVMGRREVRRVDLPIVGWEPVRGGHLGWGFAGNLALPAWEKQAIWDAGETEIFEPRLIWAPSFLRQIIPDSNEGGMAQGANAELYYWGYPIFTPFDNYSHVPTSYGLNPGGPVEIRQVSTGSGRSIFVIGQEKIWCAGSNAKGQLGLGVADETYYPSVFVEAPALKGISEIGKMLVIDRREGYSNFDCVYGISNKNVYFWGNGGTSSSLPSLLHTFPAGVTGASIARTNAAWDGVKGNSAAMLFVLSNGDVYFKGTSYSGAALGIGEEGPNTYTMQKHPFLGGVRKIVDGGMAQISGNVDEGKSIALKNDGTVWVWGYVSNYADGTGREGFVYTPEKITGLTKITDIASAGHAFFALDAYGDVWVWGGNAFSAGIRGLGKTAPIQAPPQKIDLPPIFRLCTGGGSTFFVIPKSEIVIDEPVEPEPPGADIESISWLWEWNWGEIGEYGPENMPWGESYPWAGGEPAPLPAGYEGEADWSWLWEWDWIGEDYTLKTPWDGVREDPWL